MKEMKKNLLLLFLLLPVALTGCINKKETSTKLVEHIDPFIGSVAKSKYYGRTFPGAVVPFGMVQLSPDTETAKDNTTGYSFKHKTIEGFSFVRLSGVGWFGEFGNLLVMPTNGELQTSRGNVAKPESGYRSRFSHDTEHAEAGYYSVHLDDYDVKAEMTATEHVGLLRFSFPKDSSNRIQIDLARRIGGTSVKQYIKVIDNQRIEGWMHCNTDGGGWGDGRIHNAKYTVYFSAEFSRPFQSSGVWTADIPKNQSRKWDGVNSKKYQRLIADSRIINGVTELEGEHLGFIANFPDLHCGEEVMFKAGISFVDLEGARNNLDTELKHWDFEKVVDEARHKWEKALNVIQIEGATDEQKQVFYTGMYHAMLDPRRFTDVDGRYYGGDHQIHQTNNFTCRTVFSGWDAFRSHLPLLTIIDPESVNDVVCSLVEKAELGGMGLPKWEIASSYSNCMLGDPAIPVILDAYRKGITDFEINAAYKYSKQTVMGPNTLRNGWKEYNQLAYVPCDSSDRWRGYYKGLSATLENCYADWCVGQMAKDLGFEDDYAMFNERAQYYKNVYDSETGYMRGRLSDGSWLPWNSKLDFGGTGCIESNPFQQMWFVPHDVRGLEKLLGKERFLSELEELFEKTPQDFNFNKFYNHANEPVHHVPYLFNYTHKPWLTQKWVRIIMSQAYSTGPYGIKGNEDVGQMSAWYILSAMGFHPVCPGNNQYELGSPLFAKVVVKLDSRYYPGQTFTIIANNNSPENVYVQSVSLNGKPLKRTFITHEEIVNGGELIFEMGDQPKLNN
ncbi:GH92 family glycosyl hydrolase [Carboxylicivirga sp. RSCT41]|uniref:GH92 family glycosyl hydrolase n=1 Tax=Carboxylicivirga agarovorans TaxID=3417570 RepID=UPI003D3455E7